MIGWAAIAECAGSGRTRRWALATIITLGFHLALLALILAWRSPPFAPGNEGVTVSLFPLAGSSFAGAPKPVERAVAASAKSHPSVSTTPLAAQVIGSTTALKELPKFDPPRDLQPILFNTIVGAPPVSTGVGQADAAAVTAPPPSASSGAPIKACKIYETLQAALQTSREVRSALNLIPAKSRSVANAVLLWDGRWVEASTVGGDPALRPIEAAVVESIGQASVPCQEELVRGPRVITVGDTKNTTVLAFGSGEWRWADLMLNVPMSQSSR